MADDYGAIRMDGEQNMADPTPAWQARMLLRAIRTGTLATTTDGQPFASLVTPATAPDLSVLLFLSSRSEHTRHVRADPRCALMVAGPAPEPNPQTAPRLTITGIAEPTPDPALKSRWLAAHPYAALYADFADFSLWRIRPLAGLLVGGFAQATRLRQADFSPDPDALATIAAAESSILQHCNTDHPDALALIAGTPGPWRMVTADVDGCDLAQEQRVIRIPWSAPVKDPAGIRSKLVQLTRAARATRAV
jgi:putative heme iron utilization protein